jgi:hypothetical protein
MNAPSPHPNKASKLKAFVLGCDPTAFTKEEKVKKEEERKPIPFNVVFELDKGMKYFGGINANLIEVRLSIDEVYVQNMIADYQNEETAKNKKWKETAKDNIDLRKAEFDKEDPGHTIPVLLTSSHLYDVLLNDNEKRNSPKDIYNSISEVFIPANKNKLCRPLVPFYRHYKYSMKNQPAYAAKLVKLFTL